MKLYEQLADELTKSIHSGTMQPGDRLPSVRHVSRTRSVSASTVFEAYYLMEARGLIRARERSGYFVAGRPVPLPPEPEPEAPCGPPESVPVDVNELVFKILDGVRSRAAVPLGSAFPSPLLYPLPRLAKALARSAVAMDPWDVVHNLTPGNADLRRQIAMRYVADGVHVEADDIVLTNGALDGLNLCLQAITRPGDSVVVESPGFYGALQALERLGLKAIEVPTRPREGIDLKTLAMALDMHRPAACWLMPNFQHPVGSVMSNENKRALVALLASHSVPLIEDDVYGELYFGDRRPLPAKAFDTQGLVLHCSSFSKSLAPGYRMGWAIPGRYCEQVSRLKLTSTLSTAAPIQEALLEYLLRGAYDRHLRQLRQTLAEQMSALASAVLRHFPPGTCATRPQGGYFLWVKMPSQVDALALHQAACAEGISTAPGQMFSARRAFGNCLRLNGGHPFDARMEEAVARLGQLATAQLRAAPGVSLAS